MSSPARQFSERAFYLAEFRRRSIGVAWPADEPPQAEPLASVVRELIANETRVVVLSPQDEVLETVVPDPPIELDRPDFAPQLWRILQQRGVGGLRASAEGFAEGCLAAALGLRLAKLVWIRETPPIVRRGGTRVSVVDLSHLGALLAGAPEAEDLRLEVRSQDRGLLDLIRRMIEGGIPAVNLCAPGQLAEELFTYAGAGIFFTRNRYAEVRPLGLEDFDAASDLIVRGEADGYLVPRDEAARDAILAHALGVFIEGRYLAGIGAMLPHPQENAAEIASLFALTRYVGEGAGGQIVRYAIERARCEGLDYLFSCTTSERVERFFERHGFRRVGPEEIPATKWKDYDSERRAHVRCLRHDREDA